MSGVKKCLRVGKIRPRTCRLKAPNQHDLIQEIPKAASPLIRQGMCLTIGNSMLELKLCGHLASAGIDTILQGQSADGRPDLCAL